ncbi:MAG: Mur ligase domain-containing protein, partial [Betaproteobacteria bacterium]
MIDAPSMHAANILPSGFKPAELTNALASLPVPLVDATANSREARSGGCFLAYRGTSRDGRHFIADAISRGASAVLYDPENFTWNEEWTVPYLAVPNLKSHASQIAGYVYGH